MMYKETRSKRGGKVIYSLVEALNTRTPRLTIAKKKRAKIVAKASYQK